MNKDRIIMKLSELDRRGNLLIELMDRWKVRGLRELTEEQVIGFWEENNERMESVEKSNIK